MENRKIIAQQKENKTLTSDFRSEEIKDSKPLVSLDQNNCCDTNDQQRTDFAHHCYLGLKKEEKESLL